MRTLRLAIATLLVSLAACGGSDSKQQPDATILPDGPNFTGACAELGNPVSTISSYPGMYAGTVNGAGSNLRVDDGVCTNQVGGAMGYFDPVGEDTVVKLTGLTVGTNYGVQLVTDEDLSFYVITGCDGTAGGPTAGQCDTFDDARLTTETASFTATATEEYVVVDTAADPQAPATGAFTLNVAVAQCVDDSGCSGATPACENFQCTECHTSFDCTSPSAPVCDSMAHTCGAGASTCTGDDAGESADDGPAGATMLALPTAVPTTVAGHVCNSPGTESDFYKITVAADTTLGFTLAFTGATNDLDVIVYDSSGASVGSGQSDAGINEAFTVDLTPDTYYIEVYQYLPASTVAAVPYTLGINQVACTSDFDCVAAAAPVCGANGTCAAGPNQCVGDDIGDTTLGGDDGPAGARVLATGIATSGSICNAPANERDFYKLVVTNGEGVNLSLAWTGTDDLDVAINDSTGLTYGLSFYKQPEQVAVTYLPAGTYYINVTKFGNAASTAVTAYTITATKTAAQTCATSADCAASFGTQIYRGSCNATSHACEFIPSGARAAGAACDSGTDCTSQKCSYIAFEQNAERSVCSQSCTATADCAGALSGFTCTTGFQTNLCVPMCTSDLQCGANPGSATLTTGQPWDYLTCTTGVCGI